MEKSGSAHLSGKRKESTGKSLRTLAVISSFAMYSGPDSGDPLIRSALSSPGKNPPVQQRTKERTKVLFGYFFFQEKVAQRSKIFRMASKSSSSFFFSSSD